MSQDSSNEPVILDRSSIMATSILKNLCSHSLSHILVIATSIILPYMYDNGLHFLKDDQFTWKFEIDTFHPFMTLGILTVISCFSLLKKFHHLNEDAHLYSKTIEGIYVEAFNVIRTGLLRGMKRNSMAQDDDPVWERQKKIDKHIMIPLNYCNNLITKDLKPPDFKPDSDYINLLFENPHVIAITGAPTSMWMDPTLGFFLVNSLLASLIGHVNKQLEANHSDCGETTKNLCKMFVTMRRNESHVDGYKNRNRILLEKLANGTSISSNDRFVARFIIIDDDDFKTNTVLLESLYALHELFGVHAYFVVRSELEKRLNESGLFGEYTGKIESAWRKIYSKNHKDTPEEFPNQPEFLIFPTSNGSNAEVFTYQQGEALNANFSDSLQLIKIIAQICKDSPEGPPENDDFWFQPSEKNKNNCFVHVNQREENVVSGHNIVAVPPGPGDGNGSHIAPSPRIDGDLMTDSK